MRGKYSKFGRKSGHRYERTGFVTSPQTMLQMSVDSDVLLGSNERYHTSFDFIFVCHMDLNSSHSVSIEWVSRKFTFCNPLLCYMYHDLLVFSRTSLTESSDFTTLQLKHQDSIHCF